MTGSIGLALASLVLAGCADFLYKRAQLMGVRATAFLMVQSCAFNVSNLAAAVLTDSLRAEPLLLVYGPLLGATMYTSRLLFMRSLRAGDISVNAPIFRLSFVVTAALAIGFSGESIYLGKVAGMGLAVLAVLTLLDVRPAGAMNRLRAAAPLAAATLTFGLFGWVQKLGTSAGLAPAPLLVAQGLTYLSLALPGSLLAGSLKPNRVELSHGPICGLLLSGTFLLLLFSLREGEASVNIPIQQMSFVVSTLLAAPYLGERLNRRQLLGLLAAALAVVAFNFRG